MKVKRGDVVLLSFPFSDGDATKVRPALVVQDNDLNKRLNSTVVAMITTHRPSMTAAHVTISLDTDAGRASGLLHDSTVKCHNLFTIHQSKIMRSIGKLPSNEMDNIDHGVVTALDLPR